MQRANPYRWTLIALCVLAVSTLGIAFTPTTTVRADDDFKSLKKEYETAKREETRLARLEKIIPMIKQGIGLNDKYKNC